MYDLNKFYRDFIKEKKIIIGLGGLGQEVIEIPEIKTTKIKNIFTEQFIIPPLGNCVLLIQKDEVVDHEVITIKNRR